MMTIEKISYKPPRLRSAFFLSEADCEEDREGVRECDEEFRDEDHIEHIDASSSAESDGIKSQDKEDTGSEICRNGDNTFSVPFDMFSLSGLESVLSTEVWNEVLSEEERHELTMFLPEMDQLTFMRTLKELFNGENVNFGSPMDNLFRALKEGLCQDETSLYREGLCLVKKKQHYHFLRNYHNSMISNICRIRDAWLNCRSYTINEKLGIFKNKPVKVTSQFCSADLRSPFHNGYTLSRPMPEISGYGNLYRYSPSDVNGQLRRTPALQTELGSGSSKRKTRQRKSNEFETKQLKCFKIVEQSKLRVIYSNNDETESDSSEHFDSENANVVPFRRAMSSKANIDNELVRRGNRSNINNGHLKAETLASWQGCSSSKKSKKIINGDYFYGDKGKKKLELQSTEVGTVVAEPKKKQYTPIVPTVHSRFSFSIVHLLSSVRTSFINNTPPHLTVPEIVIAVKSNPLDSAILETQEPLQDLVRGALKTLSSKTAPLGAKNWKPLVAYEKPTKKWCWIGPPSGTSQSNEVTSPESWNLPHKTLVKVVDSFANWLKSGQETLKLLGTLPSPPLFANGDAKERFRDLRAQKSLSTITPSTDQVRNYFHKEEFLRYAVPDRAFTYTAADGTKSIVAPLRRCGGKPTSKARDHFMLKRDRPPHVTILCLVRDAACRLPGSIGTRADVCTLIRDSQYVVEDVPDAQVNQVVSGALDRLHYERDPCVQFDSERKLWVYLHRDREEEDFEDDGTSSTKKWKRLKKDESDADMKELDALDDHLTWQPTAKLESDPIGEENSPNE